MFDRKPYALAAVLSIPLVSYAFSQLDDDALSNVFGRDGSAIVGDLKIDIGSLTISDGDRNGGGVSFQNISIKGIYLETIETISGTQSQVNLNTWMRTYVSQSAKTTIAPNWMGASDPPVSAVQILFPT